jgi:signal transduction histidine kinase
MSRLPVVLRISKEGGAFGAISDRTLAGLRLLLAISALLIILVDPNEPNRLKNVTYWALASYILYSLAIYIFARERTNFSRRLMHCVIWTDVLWYSALITLGTGTNAVFFFFYLFAIIAGSSRGGTTLGLTLTAVCTVIFVILNVFLVVPLQLDIPRFARRAIYMAALGYILAYWGGAEATLRRKLTFLKDLSLVSNPRFGVDRTIRKMLHRLLDFYDADYAFFLIAGTESRMDFYRVSRNEAATQHEPQHEPMQVQSNAGIPLMNDSDPAVALFVDRVSFRNRHPRYSAYDPTTEQVTDLSPEPAMDTAELLSVRSFITAPLRKNERIRGRLLVGSTHASHFDIDDAAFLQQAADLVLPVIEEIRLLDRLASEAAEEERRKLARSVHDRVIQPYLGLQIGLKALQQELIRSTGTAQSQDRGTALLNELVAMTRDGIEELRRYVSGLKNTDETETGLVDFIRRFTSRFESATGIRVEVVDSACGLTMSDRLSAEIFQMTAEALSNVHRHTLSRNAVVRLTLSENNLQLSVENDATGTAPAPFKPTSIVERAAALGARTEILRPEGKTLLLIEVPL